VDSSALLLHGASNAREQRLNAKSSLRFPAKSGPLLGLSRSFFYMVLVGRPNTPSGENDDFVVRLSAPEGDI
jgi:hypothetical protein